MKCRAVIFLILPYVLAGCVYDGGEHSGSYPNCIYSAVSGGSNLSANDIRELCEESAGVLDTRYRYEGGKIIPSNTFTRCVQKERARLEQYEVPDAFRLSKLSCKYINVK